MFDDIEAARRIVIENDDKRIVDLGIYPTHDDEGIRTDHTSWRSSYGVTLAFTDLPAIRTSALVLRGDDAGRLTSFTLFSLRAFSDGTQAATTASEMLVPNCHLSFSYIANGDGGYEPASCVDMDDRSAHAALEITGRAVVWLLERYGSETRSPRKAACRRVTCPRK